MLERLFNGQSFPTNVDETGRLVLPAKLRQKIGLDKGEAFFIAMGDTFQIWKPKTYDEVELKRTEEWLDEMPDDFDPLTLLITEQGADMAGAAETGDRPHIPVLLRPLLKAVEPVSGIWADGTFGAGGYARGLLAEGADVVVGMDRDPLVFELAADWAADYGDRLRLEQGTFSDLDKLAGELLDGVVLDLGVSSMQLDLAERGFSFMKDGPLDMRMSQTGPSAADIGQRGHRSRAGRYPVSIWRRTRLAPDRQGHRRRACRAEAF